MRLFEWVCSTRAARIAPHLAATALMLPAFLLSAALAADLTWPGDPDFFRDIAQAQVFADGSWSADAFYRAERLHYPPLAPASVAVLSKLTSVPVPRAYVLAGLGLNLLAPLAFYVLAFRLLGPAGGLLSLFSFLYLRTGPAYLLGGYAPWFFASSFAQAFCFASLLLALWMLERPSVLRDLALALMVGLTFLAHLGPAVLLACVVPALLFLELPWRAALRHLLIVGAVSGTVALPDLMSVAGHYHLRFLNAEPGQWMAGFDFYWLDLLGVWSLLGAAGILAWIAKDSGTRPARLVGLWTVSAALLLLVSVRTGFMVAPHHFLIYVRTVLDLGLGWLAARLLVRLPLRPLARGALATLALCLVLILIWPSYRRSTGLGRDRRDSLACGERADEIALYQWLRANTDQNDVILASERRSFETIGPAGRRVVAIPSAWANPFVDNERRRQHQDELIVSLRTGNWQRFCRLGERYHLTHVVRGASEPPWQVPAPHFRAMHIGRFDVHAWQTCPEPLAARISREQPAAPPPEPISPLD